MSQEKYIGYLALEIADILFTVHKGAPFPRWWCDNHNLLQEGRPFIMRFRQPSHRDLYFCIELRGRRLCG
jgi:hypothetical protein